MSRTLYVSDLDGTLLNSRQEISDYTAGVINCLVERGMLFSYATARSRHTAFPITKKLTVEIPVIVHNGTFILDSRTGERLYANYFTPDGFVEIYQLLTAHQIHPIVYAFIEGEEKFSYLSEQINRETAAFIATRRGDGRERPVSQPQKLYEGRHFYFTCIDRAEKLLPVYDALCGRYACVCQQDIYSGDYWLEIMAPGTSKANAILQLKKRLQADKIVAFGDGKNDIPMFQLADKCYAVENADPQLKALADDIIKANDCDGVAKWLAAHLQPIYS